MIRALVLGVLALSLAMLAWSGHLYWAARADAALSIRQLDFVRVDARDITSLRLAAPPESRRRRPAPGLANRVTDVVAKTGLPQAALQSLTPESERSEERRVGTA